MWVENHFISIKKVRVLIKLVMNVQMPKDDEHPFMLSGCKVMDGFGDMMVCSIMIKLSHSFVYL
jgi:hypothetical protein